LAKKAFYVHNCVENTNLVWKVGKMVWVSLWKNVDMCGKKTGRKSSVEKRAANLDLTGCEYTLETVNNQSIVIHPQFTAVCGKKKVSLKNRHLLVYKPYISVDNCLTCTQLPQSLKWN